MLSEDVEWALCAGSHFFVIVCNHMPRCLLLQYVGNLGIPDWLPCPIAVFSPGLSSANS